MKAEQPAFPRCCASLSSLPLMGLCAEIITQAKLYPAIEHASSDHCIPGRFTNVVVTWNDLFNSQGVPSSTGLKLVAYWSRLTRPVNSTNL
eukprot:scaffold79196_cov36-Cyclotella_meneghiniana.AAC.2